MDSLRLTPLDPSRPAPDLLEDLLSGIRGCWLIFAESSCSGELGDAEQEDDDRAENEEHDDAYYAA